MYKYSAFYFSTVFCIEWIQILHINTELLNSDHISVMILIKLKCKYVNGSQSLTYALF